ncbi:unnamed protein product [Somion occarium]|uniref:JmjC domain-containing protein n=1 Tax=Somion occarium TaxID=3059160 RepID=A0ABP1DSR2_9APHY
MTNRTRLTLSTIRSLSTPRVTKTTLPRPSRSLHGIPITTRAVPLSDVPITEASLSELRQLIDAPGAQPLLFRASATSDPTNTTSRASELLKNLRQGADRIVDVEYGRYDHAASGVFDRVPMRLQDYLDWLEDNTRESGSISGRQIYLAQWRAGDEIEAIRDTLKPPPMLTPLLKENLADMYQTSFFIGPTGAVTPLHYDPYVNLFHLTPDTYRPRFWTP